jgi:hypothetical protein
MEYLHPIYYFCLDLGDKMVENEAALVFAPEVAMRKLLIITLLSAGMSLAAPVTWTLSNVVFTDGGTATGWFVYETSSNTVTSYSISVSGGNTTTFPPRVYQIGIGDNLEAGVFPSQGYIGFFTTGTRLVTLPVLPLPAAGGVVSLNLTNPYGAECYNCNPYRQFASGQVTAPGTGTAVVPALSPWALAGLAILLLGCGVAVLSRLPQSKPAR